MEDATPENVIIKRKKAIIIDAVHKACAILGVPLPKINFEGCPEERNEDFGTVQLGHYHPDKNMICISRSQMYMQDSHTLRRTAIHEVTHMFEHNHDSNFVKTMDQINKDVWKAQQGSNFVSAEQNLERDRRLREEAKKSKKIKKETVDKTRCNSNICRKKRTLKKCPHCKRYFCKDHITPVIPGTTILGFDYHACPNYVDFVKTQEEAKSREYTEALDRMKGKNIEHSNPQRYKEPIKVEVKEQSETKEEKEARFELEYQKFKQDLEAKINKKSNNKEKPSRRKTKSGLNEEDQERLVKKAYEGMDTEFGEGHGDNRWSKKKRSLWEKIKSKLRRNKDM